ncbi:MAG: Spy/CpxP family protein refolding chaperone [Spirochaetia bacterium]|nr:Spy/CpxP family protein refolding chaperone [Spirochaetia bacterium]
MKKLSYLVFILSLFTVPAVFAEMPEIDDDGPGAMASGRGIYRLIEKLNLTDAQEEKLEEMRAASKRELFALRNEIRIATWDIQDEFKKEKPDREKIDALTDRVCEMQKKMMKIRTNEMFKIREILTAEQFKSMTIEMDKAKRKAGKKTMKKLFEKDK